MNEALPIPAMLDSVHHVIVGPLSARLGSVGRSTSHVEIRVVDANDEDLPPFAVGKGLTEHSANKALGTEWRKLWREDGQSQLI